MHGDVWKGKFGSPFYEGGFFPHFDNTAYERTATKGSIKFTSDLGRTCPFPWQIGFSVFDKNDIHVKTEYFGRTYNNPYDFDTYDVTIGGLDNDGEYKVYPAINVFNHDVLASPYVTVRSCPVKLSDFKVTNKQYKERGFTNDGMTYDYCFNVSVTATLDNSDDVHDWGYVYRDPNGREKKISCVQPSGYGTTYTDTRWAYYRNESKSTCTLYGYVEYVDSDKPVYGEPHDYLLEYTEQDIEVSFYDCSFIETTHFYTGSGYICGAIFDASFRVKGGANISSLKIVPVGNFYSWNGASYSSINDGDYTTTITCQHIYEAGLSGDYYCYIVAQDENGKEYRSNNMIRLNHDGEHFVSCSLANNNSANNSRVTVRKQRRKLVHP